ncbi:MAG TPA: DNA integrity scanning diadenylate cyclase DisA [Beutenbergiaceae bacterium]|nr:DNA integrity scanning diadenylate cyclase DisA [Beutenbergiaceae bacterium]
MSELPNQLREALASVAPGTELRDGLERILRGRTGALIVLGHNDTVDTIASGGFHLDVEFSATRLRELAKMDGAIVIDPERNRIMRAAAQLLPDARIETSESGTRHRTAERAAKQTGLPVISVSASMRIVALYVAGQRHELEDSDIILSRANQALATLERYKTRLDEVSGTLSALEIEDLVTVRDVVTVAQRLEMVRRISEEIDDYFLELGTNGRLLALQFDEMLSGIGPDLTVLIRDYVELDEKVTETRVLGGLAALSSIELLDLTKVARVLRLGGRQGEALDSGVSPRGYRMLKRIPRLPAAVVNSVVLHFGTLQRMLAASIEDLETVDGVGATRARAVREGLSRQAESSLLERFV